MALVDADEDSAAMVRRIAAKSEAANEAARAKRIKEEEDAKNSAGNGQSLVTTGLVGSVVLSLPFFLPNLIRLGKKITSGGADDGYGSKK
jgi:biotin carboxyl carrier protein